MQYSVSMQLNLLGTVFLIENRGYSKMDVEDIELKDILYWIVLNSDDTEAIDKINKTTFPFTTRYKEFQQ